MESTEKKEALMRIKATSKNELYRKLFDQYGMIIITLSMKV